MTSAQIVETSVNVISNRPSQDYTHPDDRTLLNDIFDIGHPCFDQLTPAFFSIAGFHCHTIIKTIQHIKSRIKEIKEDEYSNSLTKVQVCAMFRAGDIRRNVFPNL